MKRDIFITILLLAIIGLSIGALRAQTWNIGTPTASAVTATLSGGTLTISGTGAMQNWIFAPDRPWYSVRHSITTVIINSGVTTIGTNAFAECDNLTSVTIPNSVTFIEDAAFLQCSSLTSITIGNSVKTIGEGAFLECSSLMSITIPSSVTSIGDDAFNGCSSLASITIGNSVTSIGSGAFQGCSGLTTVNYNATNCVEFESSPFRNCTAFTTLNIGNNVQTIPASFFEECPSLTGALIIPNSVTSIGEYAFYYCSLTSVTIGNSVISIGEWAFADCLKLTNITVAATNPNYCDINGVLFNKSKTTLLSYPAGKVGGYAIPASVTTIGTAAFFDCIGLTGALTIPNSVTSIEEAAFAECRSLTSITIGNSVKTIGEQAFNRCIGLTSVTIPNSVTSIEEAAFHYCNSLTSVTIPNSVTSIGYAAFASCSKLVLITCLATTPPTIDQSTFLDISSQAKVYVSCASLSKYKAAPYWQNLTYGNCNELAINDFPQTAAIAIYPNPVTDKLTIESDTYIIYSIQIVDLMGKTVLVAPLINNTINVSSLPAGVYFLKIETDKGEVVKKIVKN